MAAITAKPTVTDLVSSFNNYIKFRHFVVLATDVVLLFYLSTFSKA